MGRRILCLSDPLAGAYFTLREAERDFDVSSIRGVEKPWPKPDQIDHRVRQFIDERVRYAESARQHRCENNQGDYWRWQGHMEARRRLAKQLGVDRAARVRRPHRARTPCGRTCAGDD